MRLPKKNLLEKYRLETSDEITVDLEVYNKAQMYNEEWKDDPKLYTKTIKKIETYIRNSYEYKSYVKYLKECLNINSCFFLSRACIDNHSKFHIEFHHGPYTLYDITSIIFTKYFGKDSEVEKPNFFKVANEVVKNHYELNIGLIPLSTTAHELVHNGDIFIPVDHYFGNFRKFEEKYNKYINEDLKSMILIQEKMTQEWNNKEEHSVETLNKKFVYVNIEGIMFPKKISIDKK